jgi:hypothetical protein
MSPSEMRARTTTELGRVPRGEFAQNMYRMLLQQYLMNSLGSSPQVLGLLAAHAAALRSVRESFPISSRLSLPTNHGALIAAVACPGAEAP